MTPIPAAARPSPRARWWLWWLAAVLAVGLLMFAYHHLGALAEGQQGDLRPPLINELTAALGSGVLFFGVRALVRRWPLDDGGRWRRLPIYLAGVGAFSAAHTSLNWALRGALHPLAGLPGYDYGRMPLRYLMELPIDTLVVAIMVGALHAWRRVERARAGELAATRLERSLVAAELRGLQLQLQPHFLFNTLNTISSMMYRDVDRADAMLARLAALLRSALRSARADRVRLADELAALDDYLAIMHARFERLVVDLDVEPAAASALVPPLLLQPLVENAIRHGAVEARGAGRVGIAARRDGDRLRLTIDDDGPGLPAGADPEAGVGLGATAERLRLLYGAAHRFDAANRADRGFRVSVEVPFEAAT